MPKRRSLESAGISDAQYLQIMERVAEQNYRDWGLPNSNAALIQALNDNRYDYRGYYNKYPNSRANASTHWTDEFKTVYHPTFSKESKYSGKKSQYNPKGLVGGIWSGETFIPAYWQRNKKEFGGDNWYEQFKREHPTTTEVASYLPVVGSAMDVYEAVNNPTGGNITNAAISVGADILGYRLLKNAGKAYKTLKAAKKAKADDLIRRGFSKDTAKQAAEMDFFGDSEYARYLNTTLTTQGGDKVINYFQNQEEKERQEKKEGGIHRIIKRGDTLSKIAKEYTGKPVRYYQLDNGSYNRGLRTRNEKNISAQDLKDYDKQNTTSAGGRHFMYIRNK